MTFPLPYNFLNIDLITKFGTRKEKRKKERRKINSKQEVQRRREGEREQKTKM
jgi:hypothetical protein